jgi:hypothetical protein
MSHDDAMHVDDTPADMRDFTISQYQTVFYSLETGYRVAPLRGPPTLQTWVHRDSEHGYLLTDCNALHGKLPEMHLLNIDYSKNYHIPFPYDLDAAHAAITRHDAINKILNKVANSSVFPLIIHTPPLWVFLNSVKLGKAPAKSNWISPFTISTSLLAKYSSVMALFLDTVGTISEERTNIAKTVFNDGMRGIAKHMEGVLFSEPFMMAGKRFYHQIGTPDIERVVDQYEQQELHRLATELAAATINSLRTYEHFIWSLVDEKLEMDLITQDVLTESQLPTAEELGAFQEPLIAALKRDLNLYLKLRMETFHIACQMEMPEGAKAEIFGESIPSHPISIQGLKVFLSTCYISDKFEKEHPQ